MNTEKRTLESELKQFFPKMGLIKRDIQVYTDKDLALESYPLQSEEIISICNYLKNEEVLKNFLSDIGNSDNKTYSLNLIPERNLNLFIKYLHSGMLFMEIFTQDLTGDKKRAITLAELDNLACDYYLK